MNPRVPPQNIEAEMAVLGAMLLGDRGAIERVTEVLSKEDFYREAHARIYEGMLALSERDEPVDIVTLKDELTRRGVLDQVGGYLYLMQLAEFVPTTANVAYYAKIVAEKGVLRRLIETASEIAGLAYGEIDEVNTLVDQAERAIFNVARKRRAEGFTPLRPLLTNAFEQIDTLYHEKGITTGVNTGFKDLNYITSGLQPGDLIIIAARPSMGKCLTAGMLVDNPDTGERLTIEDAVQRRMRRITGISECGRVRATEVSDWIDSGIKPVFRVTTRTGRFVEVTGHHPFLTLHGWQPLHDLTVGDQIAVPRQVPVFGGNTTLTQERVRLLAYLIAEGGLTDSCPEWTNTDPILIADFRDIIAREFPELRVRQDGITYIVAREYVVGQRKNQPNPLIEWLRELDLWGKKADAKSFPTCVWEWPEHYLAPFLQVLMSCDATIYAMGGFPRIEFAVASEHLARDVQHALLRFGVVSKFWQKSSRCWRVEVTDPEAVERYQAKIGWLGEKAGRQFAHQRQTRRRGNAGHPDIKIWDLVRARASALNLSLTELARQAGEFNGVEGFNPHTNRGLPRHRLAAYAEVLQDANLQKVASPELYWDTIVAIEPLGEQQVYDLTVPDGANFIAQDIVVHNTALTMNIGQNAALIDNKVVATFSLEMSKESLVQRLICSEARVDAHKLRTGFLQDEDWSRLADAVQRLWDAPLFIDDTTDMSALEMRAKCRRLRAEQGALDLVIVDYLQLMSGSSRNSENRNQEITEIARGLKSLARELEVPVIALSQLSRSVERREDKRPMLSDLRECLTGETRLWDAETGLLVPIREVRPGQRVLAADKNQKVVSAAVSQVWEKGVKPIFRVTTETGRVIRCTDNHPFLTPSGYVPLAEIGELGVVGASQCRQPQVGGDLLWERIRSIEPDGEEETFDICVPKTGCFLAEGLVVHNSGAIEAEADVVGFIYRPAYYARKDAVSQEGDEKAEEARGGGVYEGEEAEVIIAKQRNGPTGTVKLAFLPKFARFADLEQNMEESPF